MAENGQRIRVTLRWLQVLDKLEPWYKSKGEFVFWATVTSGETQEYRFPDSGHYPVSDHPRWNKLEKLNKLMYDGLAGDSLVVELRGVELDDLSADDELERYRREFTGPVESWVGRHLPGDEGPEDPENMSNWRVCYDVEMI